MEQTSIRTRTAEIWLGDDGIVRLVIVVPDVQLTINEVRENVAVIAEVCGGERRPLFTDVRKVKSSDRDSRTFVAGPDVANLVTAMAGLVDSLTSKWFVNFFVKVSKPLYPTRMFTSEDEAIIWLKEHL